MSLAAGMNTEIPGSQPAIKSTVLPQMFQPRFNFGISDSSVFRSWASIWLCISSTEDCRVKSGKKMAVHRGRIYHCSSRILLWQWQWLGMLALTALTETCFNRVRSVASATSLLDHHLAQLYYEIIFWLHGVTERLRCPSGWKYFNASLCRLFAAIHCAGWWGYGDELDMIPALKEFSA